MEERDTREVLVHLRKGVDRLISDLDIPTKGACKLLCLLDANKMLERELAEVAEGPGPESGPGEDREGVLQQLSSEGVI